MILKLNSFLPCLRNGLLNMYLVPLLLPLVFVMMPDYWQVTDKLVKKFLFTLSIFNHLMHAINRLNCALLHTTSTSLLKAKGDNNENSIPLIRWDGFQHYWKAAIQILWRPIYPMKALLPHKLDKCFTNILDQLFHKNAEVKLKRIQHHIYHLSKC